jgi:hypothetical protein
MTGRRGAVMLALLASLVATDAAAQRREYGTMYDDALLASRQREYREVVLWNLQNVFLPKLTAAERQKRRASPSTFRCVVPSAGSSSTSPSVAVASPCPS